MQNLNKKLKRIVLEKWVELAREEGIEYEIVEQDGDVIAKPVNEQEAMLKQFGSGTKNIKAEFWFEDVKNKLRSELRK